MLLITGFTASILSALCIMLALKVISIRQREKISMGDGGNDELFRAIRAQANLLEYAPLTLILLACAEINGVHWLILLPLALVFLLGRLIAPGRNQRRESTRQGACAGYAALAGVHVGAVCDQPCVGGVAPCYMNFDYVIVGAGSAGCVLANKLSASGRDSVLVLEAGPSDQRFYVRMPMGYGKVYYDKNVNWKYQTEPVPGLNNRPSYWPRGKVLGGSSSINAMVYVRGHPDDYQQWAEVASGWAWSAVAPVFKRMEDFSEGADDYRGVGGPVPVQDIANDAHPLCRRYLHAAEQCQIPFNPDYNGASMDGAALYQITTKKGLRASAAVCYLHPALHRHNLQLETHAQVTRIEFDGLVATGVCYEQNGHVHIVHARKEIILCGGAINSPQLLQLSGIGPHALLQQHGIQTVHANNDVGQHLQDHLGADVVCRTSEATLNQQLRPLLGKLRVGLEFLLNRRGPLTLSLNQAGGFVSTNKATSAPDLQLYFSPVSYTRAPVGTRPLINPDPFPGFLLGFNPCKPSSRGSIEICSSNYKHAPLLQPNYLDTQSDKNLMLSGMHLMRQLVSAPAFKDVIEQEILPGEQCNTDEQLMNYVQDNAWTVFHQCGTCRMGDNATTSVVDGRLKVHGVYGLRVADASVFPSIPTGNTNAPAIMVGERAADFILQDNRSTTQPIYNNDDG